MKKLKIKKIIIASKFICLSAIPTMALANNSGNINDETAQTQCYKYGDINYSPSELKKDFNATANSEVLADITINSAKKYYKTGNLDYYKIYKQGYTLASSWEFSLNVLNEYLPTHTNFDSISIKKYCALRDKMPPEINMQMNTWDDAAIFKIGVDLAKTALNKDKVSEVFTDKSVESKVKFIFTFWGVLQEYTYESIGNGKVFLFVKSDVNKDIDPYYLPDHPALPTLMWIGYPSVFYNQMSKAYDTNNTVNGNTEYKQANISEIQNMLVNLSNKTSSKNLNNILLKVSKNPNLINDISKLSNAKSLNMSDQDKVNLITKIISQLKPLIGETNNKGIIYDLIPKGHKINSTLRFKTAQILLKKDLNWEKDNDKGSVEEQSKGMLDFLKTNTVKGTSDILINQGMSPSLENMYSLTQQDSDNPNRKEYLNRANNLYDSIIIK